MGKEERMMKKQDGKTSTNERLYEKYWTESVRGDREGDMEKEDHQ